MVTAAHDTQAGNVPPIRPIDDEAAIAWLRAQPGRRTRLSGAELGRRWGWKRQRVGRRIKAWVKDGRITRRGNTITYVDAHVTDSAEPATQVDFVPPPVPPLVPSVVPARPIEDVRLPTAEAPPIQPAERHIDWTTALVALGLACVSAGFSIYGFISIFVGAFWPVIAMGVALEAGKLRAVAWIGHHRTTPWWGLKGVLAGLVAVLMILNAVGCYGFLSKAHIAAQVEVEAVGATTKAGIEGKISAKNAEIANLSTRIAQIDAAVSKATEGAHQCCHSACR